VDSCDLLCLDLEVAERLRDTLDPERSAELAATLKVFADPTRLMIVQALAQHELCGCDLGWITGQSDKVVSHHLSRLRREGLIESRRDGKIVFTSLTETGHALIDTINGILA
jgi:ArsR family transcriptional regulator, lead/cadmium/zinc/bismuth-responsive transcriptional repressor